MSRRMIVSSDSSESDVAIVPSAIVEKTHENELTPVEKQEIKPSCTSDEKEAKKNDAPKVSVQKKASSSKKRKVPSKTSYDEDESIDSDEMPISSKRIKKETKSAPKRTSKTSTSKGKGKAKKKNANDNEDSDNDEDSKSQTMNSDDSGDLLDENVDDVDINEFKPGQTKATPSPGYGDRVFYESLYQQDPTSLMALKWCVEYGVFPAKKSDAMFKELLMRKEMIKLDKK